MSGHFMLQEQDQELSRAGTWPADLPASTWLQAEAEVQSFFRGLRLAMLVGAAAWALIILAAAAAI